MMPNRLRCCTLLSALLAVVILVSAGPAHGINRAAHATATLRPVAVEPVKCT